ncbi:helix-turn-helix domain-containing protein [Amycolatopsis sp. cmx-11-12]|uniref:AlbA family DNA-binding domain-containing protein n=1 Tax=Amycolatopsis sp. cmx-11-12 TaxID=2785795 RepID=UPI00391811DF
MAQPQSLEPVVIEPVVNREKLRELLALETEYPTLDFKSCYDLTEKHDQVDLAKHVGAMSVRGGFLVIGVDGQGKPTGNVTVEQAKLFDEARLRPKLLKWLPDTLEIYSQAHDVDGHHVVLVHVAPNPAGCAFFRADGQYDQPGRASKVVFREGEVFHRDGTQSVRLNHQGLEQVIRQRVERERERWQAEHAESYRRLADELRAGATGQHVAQGPSVEFNLALEPDVLVEAAIELLRANDDIPFRRMLSRAVPELRDLFRSGDEEGANGRLDRLTCLAATFLELVRHEWFEQVVDTLMSIYGIGFENEAPIVNAPPRRSAVLWLAIIERVLALGSLAVRRNDWQAVRALVARRHPDMNEMYTTWLRHAMTMASRAELLTTRDGSREVLDSLLSRARNVARRIEWLRPDAGPEDEKILTGLTQFDFLAGLVTMANSDNKSGIVPNFARFDTERTRPAAQRLLREPDMRQIIYPGDDQFFADALHTIDRDAQRAGFLYDGWEGYTRDVNIFISEQGVGTEQQ